MKFMHIGDLHLGKRFNDVNLLEDQEFVLNQIVSLVEKENIDALLLAGDIYDKSNPNSNAMTLFNDFITKIVELNKKIFIISGNHDSEQRIAYFSSLIKNVGVYASNVFKGTTECIQIEDEYGLINIHLLPFVKPYVVRKYYEFDNINTYQDALKLVLDKSNINKKERNILVAHQFITGSLTCDSEEMAIGGLDNIDANVFDMFDYVALGHIHKAQKVLRETLRYSGSIMKYSFSEINHVKSVCVIDFKDKGNIDIDLIPLKFLRDVREVKGSFSELMSMDYSEDYLRVILTDEVVDPDARVSLSTVFPNMMSFVIQNSKTSEEVNIDNVKSIDDKTISELFSDFYALQNNNISPSDEHIKVLEAVLEEIEGEEE